jgi:hypothetical protein
MTIIRLCINFDIRVKKQGEARVDVEEIDARCMGVDLVFDAWSGLQALNT